MSAPLKETHAGGVVQVALSPGQRFGILPRSIPQDLRLPPDARLVASWLATQAEGFQIVVSVLCAHLGLTKGRWQRIARQLQAAGYLSRSCSPSGPQGRWVWKILFYSDPSGGTGAESTVTVAWFSGDGETADGEASNRRIQDEKNNLEDPQKRERERRAPARPRTAQRRRASRMGGQFEIDQQTGIHHNPSSARDQEALRQIALHPAAVVRSSVSEAAAMDDQGRAFPSAVLRSLLRQSQKPRATPAWAKGAARPQAQTCTIIEGDASWID